MATRRKNTKAISGEYSWLLESGDVAEQGKSAGLDTATGSVRPMGTSATQNHVGFFAETLTGDGVKKVRVEVPDEITAEWLKNDANPNDVAITDIGSECYAKDAQTVSMLSTSRSKAGRILDYDADSNLVLVQSGAAVTGPTGASGYGLAAGAVATRAALKAVAAADRFDAMVVMIVSDGSLWRFAATSVLQDDEAQELVLEPDASTGAWLRMDKAAILRLPIAFGDADHATIETVPAGFVMRLIGLPFWEITTGFAGGASSAIGIATDITGYDTAGDILGGAAGDVEATLIAGIIPGTIGPKLDTEAERQALVLQGGDLVTYEEITSAFTSGAGFVCLPVAIIAPAA